ncbi:putative exonuclease [Erysiphe neolycopersici]|uniref:Putative exonuclease n=1 Tax=Erysiphe neolycopersici TaxID=212602 RepID=A0A420HNG3_9PEZI|nr:putative exonuclease [Erysiphe neolycopersici]
MTDIRENVSRPNSQGSSKKRKFEGNHGHSTSKSESASPSIEQNDYSGISENRLSSNHKLLTETVDNDTTYLLPNKKKSKKIPKTESDNYPSITFSEKCKLQTQIKLSDLQSLILYILADGTSPNFVSIRNRSQIRKVVVLMVPGLELSMFDKSLVNNEGPPYSSPDFYYPKKLQADQLPENLQLFAYMFEHVWPVKTPGDDKQMKMYSPIRAMFTAPIPRSNEEKRILKKIKGAKPAREPYGWKNKPVFITELCHTAEELLEFDFVLHPSMYNSMQKKEELVEHRKLTKTSEEFGWVDSNVSKFEIEPNSNYDADKGTLTADWEVLAIDCEMCLTGESEFSLTRISVVGWDGSVVLDELVRPEKPIINYLTQYSGITEEKLKNVDTTLADIQKKLVKLLHPRSILIGHSLNSDLTALKLTHPYIIDTVIIYPHPRGPPLRCSLKWLAQRFLSREIQKGGGTIGSGAGHDSIEDAKTCIDLVRQKCEKGKEWGTSESQGENLFKRISRSGVQYKCQKRPNDPSLQDGKSTAAVDWGNPSKGPGAAAHFPIGCNNDEEVMEGVIRAVKGDDDGRVIPGGGVDFIWGRLRELESLKGWWNNNRQNNSNVTGVQEQKSDDVCIKTDLECKASLPASTMGLTSSSTNQDSEDVVCQVTSNLTQRIFKIYSALPPCTAFVIYSGSGDPIEMNRLQVMHSTFRREYRTKKWDQLSVKWTDTEEQALRKAHLVAKQGLGFLGIK